MIRALSVGFGLLSTLGTPSAAETARVLSGEHGSFTRLVIELPVAQEWTVGRTPDGYAFATRAEEQPLYDLSNVWQRIAQTRLGAVEVDPETGELALTLACDCHVFPFEYRSGVVVLDIKPGPPPAASAFEAAFRSSDPAASTPAASGGSGGYVWLSEIGKAEAPSRRAALPLPLDTGGASLDPLRDALLKGISQGAADGVVDMRLPGKPRKVADSDDGGLPWSLVRIGERPGLSVMGSGQDADAGTGPSACLDDDLVDLASWGRDAPVGDLLAEARSGLFGEFDAPDTKAILRSVQLHLYLGFGAEARLHAALVDDPSATDAISLYRSMARITDDESDPQTPFAKMLGCDGPEALWAALTLDRLPSNGSMNRKAILRAYLALPSHLRRHFGSRLAEKFLAAQDIEGARLIRDAIERTPDSGGTAVALLDASAKMHSGKVDAAQAEAELAVSLDGDNPDGLVALVETHFLKLEPIGPDVAEALSSLQGEMAGTVDGQAVTRALVLALGLSGQTDAAFLQESANAVVVADLWRVVQARATDDDFLRHAVLALGVARPDTSSETSLAIAGRLLALGFPDASLGWIGPVSAATPPQNRLVAARAALATKDARSTLKLLAGSQGPDVEELRAMALVQLGDFSAASQAFAAAGNDAEVARLGLWQGDWAELGPETPDMWLEPARHLGPSPGVSDLGPLARGGRMADESQATRQAVEALLSSVASPHGG
jgi:hypothetical protein